MIKVGVTGGIGSGKSLICQVFALLGVPVYNADDAAKDLMDSDPEIKKGLTGIFGPTLYQDGKLDRRMLSGLIFEDPISLAEVNSIVHPKVVHHFIRWCTSFTGAPFVIHESAILFESNVFSFFDYIILVTAPEEIRIQRVLNRPGMTREKIIKIMNNQLPDEKKIVHSNVVINNDETTLILPLILSIYEKMRN